MTDDLNEYHRLWDGSEDGWVLLRSSLKKDSYSPYNRKGFILLIESEETSTIVCQRMIDAGCEILDELPDATDQTKDGIR